MRTMTIQKAIEFIKLHKTLKDWTEDEIAMLIHESIQSGTMAWSTDQRNEFNGILLGRVDKERHRFHVVALVAEGKGVLKRMMQVLHKYSHGYKITGFRHQGKRLVEFSKKLSLIERL